MTTRLITIPPSHYCEKARWALDRAGLAYVEEPHVPPLHIRAVRAVGGRRSTPVLVAPGAVHADSTDILGWIQQHPDARWRPYPDGAVGDEVRALEDELDEVLGPHARRLAYHHLMPRGDLFVAALTAGVPAAERLVFRALYRPIRLLMRRSMRIDDEGARRSAVKVDGLLDGIDLRLADGRRWLVGDVFTAADLTLAALLAPLVVPTGYPAAVAYDAIPPSYRAIVDRYRARPSGDLAARAYADHRGRA